MPREETSREQLFAPAPAITLREKDDALSEYDRPCGRFRSLLSLEDKLRLTIARRMQSIGPLSSATSIIGGDIPFNWQILLNYLHAHKIIDRPRFRTQRYGNDLPKSHGVSLVSPARNGGKTCSGSGNSPDRETAMSKAVGEMLERYFLYSASQEKRSFSHRELQRRGVHALDIAELNRHLPFQIELFPKFARTEDTPLCWVPGTELLSGKRALIPAQLVFWNYKHEPSEAVVVNPTTSGGAGHFTRDEALVAALLEGIQRDGFLIYWLNALSPKIIDVASSADPEILSLLAYLARYRLEVFFLDTTTDIGVPSVACAIVDMASEEPIISMGGGAGFDSTEIILQSVREAMSVYNHVACKEPFRIPKEYIPFTDNRIGRKERLAAWRGKEMLERFKFFISGEARSITEFAENTAHLKSPQNQLAFLLEKFRSLGKGYEVYSHEVQNDILKTLGYHVVKAVVPRLIPLYLSEHMATLDSVRLREVPAKIGYSAAKEYNPWPHLFP